MAKADTVEIPVADLRDMQARLAMLERQVAVQQEKADGLHEKRVYDAYWDRKVKEVGRTAAERSQDVSDLAYGAKAPRWRVSLDGRTEDGKQGPNISEHPALLISANSEDEASARWLKLCGIRKHDYRLKAERVAQVGEAAEAVA